MFQRAETEFSIRSDDFIVNFLVKQGIESDRNRGTPSKSDRIQPNNSQIICLICFKRPNEDSTACYTQNIHIVSTNRKFKYIRFIILDTPN